MTNEKMQEYKKRVEQFMNCMSIYDDDAPDEVNDRVVREVYQNAKQAICSFICDVQTEMLMDFSYAKVYFPDEVCIFTCGVQLAGAKDYENELKNADEKVRKETEQKQMEHTEQFEKHLEEMGDNPWLLFKKHMNDCAHGIVCMLMMKGIDVEIDAITPELLAENDIQDVIGISNVVKRYYGE